MAAIFLAGCLTASATTAFAQSSSQSGQQNQGQPGQQPNANKDQKPADSGSSLAIPNQPPVNAEEDAAAKAFQAMPNTDLPKKIAAGEDFLKKYPDSRHRSVIYSALVFDYIQTNNSDKAFEIGDKEVALKPDDVQTMAVLSQTMTRAMGANTPSPKSGWRRRKPMPSAQLKLLPRCRSRKACPIRISWRQKMKR